MNNDAKETVYDKRTKDDFEITWYNGTVGAGGQNHQKTQNCCRMRHIPTGIVKTAQTRSRVNSLQNATEALCAELDRHKGIMTTETERVVRRNQVGSGKKADKRRSIRVQADQVIDHITGKRMTASEYMKGGMDRLW
jgi:protein subunit release factor A